MRSLDWLWRCKSLWSSCRRISPLTCAHNTTSWGLTALASRSSIFSRTLGAPWTGEGGTGLAGTSIGGQSSPPHARGGAPPQGSRPRDPDGPGDGAAALGRDGERRSARLPNRYAVTTSAGAASRERRRSPVGRHARRPASRRRPRSSRWRRFEASGRAAACRRRSWSGCSGDAACERRSPPCAETRIMTTPGTRRLGPRGTTGSPEVASGAGARSRRSNSSPGAPR